MTYLQRVTLFMCMYLYMVILLAIAHAESFRSTQHRYRYDINMLCIVCDIRDFMFHSNALKSIIKVVVVISFTHPILTLNI